MQAMALYNGARIIFGRAFAFRLVIPLASQGGGRGIEDEDSKSWKKLRMGRMGRDFMFSSFFFHSQLG